MANRSIAIRITIDNKDAINAVKAQVLATKALQTETDKHTHLQNGLTNSFIKGNLAARAISIGYGLAKDALFSLVKAGIDFEFTMAKIGAVSGASKLALQSLETTVRELSLSTNQNQADIAKAALEMGKMGLSARQVELALGGVVKLSRALDEDLVRTGETVVGVMNAYNMSANEIDKITNQLAFTVKESALSVESFGVAFGYVGGTASAAGVTFEELQGAMDILSNSGIKASTIGTGLRRVIADLSDENSKAAKAAGGTIESYGGLVEALKALKDKNLDASDYTAIFGRTASSVSAIAVKYASVIEDLAKKTGAVGDIVDPMSDKMNNTFKGAIDGITSSWKELGIEISKSTGFLTSFAQLIDKALTKVSESFKRDKVLEEFKKRRPEAYLKDTEAIYKESSVAGTPIRFARTLMSGNPVSDREVLAEGKYFQRFELIDYPKILKQEQDKANSIELLQESLGKQGLPKGWDPDKASQFDIKPEDTAMFNRIQRLWGTDDKGFQEVWNKAKLNWALKAEKIDKGDEFDQSILNEKRGKPKAEPYVELDPFVMMGDELNAIEKNGMTYQENFTKKLEESRAKEKKSPVEANAIKPEDIKAFGDALAYVEERSWGAHASFVAMQTSIQGVNGSMDILSGYLVEGIFSNKKDPFKGISDAFGNFAKKMATDIIALVAKILFFRGALALIGFATGGAGNALTPFVTQVATASTGVKFASGTDQVVNKPTLFMAGESGKERVTVTPRSKMSQNRSGASIVVNIQGDVLDGSKFTEAVEAAQRRLNRRMV